jgi:hypothetical protein
MRRRTDRQNRDGRGEKRHCVDRECGTCAERGDEQAAERRSGEAEGDRSDELVERVRRREIGRRHDVRHDCVERRREEGSAHAVHRDEHDELPEPKHAGERERGKQRDSKRASEVGPQQDGAPVEPVAQHTPRQQERDRRHRHGDAQQCQRGGRVPQLECLPGHRDEEDAVADERDGQSRPEDAEVAVA